MRRLPTGQFQGRHSAPTGTGMRWWGGFRACLTAVALTVWSSACGGGGDSVGPVEVGAVVVTAPIDSLTAVGQTLQLSALVSDKRGSPLPSEPVTWTSSSSAIVTVSRTGLVTAVGNGVATIAASAGGISGNATVTVVQVVTAVRVVAMPDSLFSLGETTLLTATPVDANGHPAPGHQIRWSSSDSTVLTVGAAGLATAVTNGSVTVSASSDSITGTVKVTVKQKVAVIGVSQVPPSFGALGQSAQLVATLTDARGNPVSGETIRWTSSNPAIASVTAGGVVTAKDNGGATITASVGTVSGTANVVVQQVVAAVSVGPTGTSLPALGQTVTLTADATDANGHPVAQPGLAWTSADTTVARVTAAGVVTATGNGTTTITAAAGPVSSSVGVTVQQVVTGVSITPGTTTLDALGKTIQMAATEVDANGYPVPGASLAWSSSDPTVATISPTGLVTAVTNGNVTLTANAATASGTASITVQQAPATVNVSPSLATLPAIGHKLQYSATALDANGHPVPGAAFTWASSHQAIVAVDQTGVVTALAGGGPVTISAAVAGKNGTATAIVEQVVVSVPVAPAGDTLRALGSTTALTATPTDANGHPVIGATVSWLSSDPTVATVSASGLVTAIRNGAVTVTANSNGISGTTEVIVAQVVTSVAVTPTPATLTSIGATVQLTATPKDANGNAVPGQAVQWSSGNPGAATVSGTGLVTSTGNGAATITATVNGVSGTATVTVAQAVASVTITPSTPALTSLGATVQLTATPMDANGHAITGLGATWQSTNPAVATVNAGGLLTAVASGSVTITATVNGVPGATVVSVAQAVAGVTLAPTTTTLTALGATTTLSATPHDANNNPVPGRTITWTSSNPAVATVDATGLITSVANGSTVITAAADGNSSTATVIVAQVVSAVSLTPSSTLLPALGATVQLTATPLDANGHPVGAQTITWISSNPALVTIGAGGLATAVANGTATISATVGGFSSTATVTVAQVVTNVAVAGGTTLTALGATTALTATPTDANGAAVVTPVTWSSSNPAAVPVSTSGLVTAVANGAATITATAGGVAGTASVTVAQAVNTITVAPATTTLDAVGNTQQLTATARDANNNVIVGQGFAWSSSNGGAVTVSGRGLATAVANGAATITAAAGGKSGAATVTVAQVTTTVTVTPETTTLTSFGATQQLTATARDANGNTIPGQTATWASSSSAAVTVNAAGITTAVANGSATITATIEGISGTATVTVAQAVSSISVSPPATTITSLGGTQQLTATPLDANGNTVEGRTITWTSANGAVATVDAVGLVTSVTNGTATIIAAADGKSGTAAVTVNQDVDSVTVTPPTTTLTAIGQTVQLTASAVDGLGSPVTGRPVTWTSSNTAAVTVNGSGLATAVANGTATITATIGGESGTAAVTVAQVVGSVTLTPASTTLNAFGATVQLTATPKDANGHTVPGQTATWGSSNTGAVTVNASGLATAEANGTSTITATIAGKSATATVNVTQTVNTVAVTPSTATLTALGATVQLTATPKDANGNTVTGQTITWSSSSTARATVSGSGLVTAVSNGTATITASTAGRSGTSAITVAQAVNTITVSPATTTLTSIGAQVTLSGTARDANNNIITGQTFSWSTTATAVLAVNAGTGLVTARANGTGTVVATAGGKTGSATVTVAQVVASVVVSPSTATLTAAGQTVQLTATARDANGNAVSGQTATWSSSNTARATVSSSGRVTAIANGTATITARVSGINGTATITVNIGGTPPPSGNPFVVLVVEENTDLATVTGNSGLTFFQTLRATGAEAMNYYANTHPSIGNYFMMTTGQIVTNDDSYTGTITADNLIRQLISAGKTWKSYAEGLPSIGYLGYGEVGDYAARHNPPVYFSDVRNSSAQANRLVPFTQFETDLANNALPDFSLVIPNLCNDAHDCPVATADQWLHTNLDPLLADPRFQANGLLIVTFDESSGDNTNGGGKIFWAAGGGLARAGAKSSTVYQHQSTLRTILQVLGVATAPGAAATAPVMSDLVHIP